jgi:hypothetical protein
MPRKVWRASFTRMPGPYVLVRRSTDARMPYTVLYSRW